MGSAKSMGHTFYRHYIPTGFARQTPSSNYTQPLAFIWRIMLREAVFRRNNFQRVFIMQPQHNLSGGNGATDQSAIVLTQGGAPMPKKMRLCRSWGDRLGEGPAAYTAAGRVPHAATPKAQFTPAHSPP